MLFITDDNASPIADPIEDINPQTPLRKDTIPEYSFVCFEDFHIEFPKFEIASVAFDIRFVRNCTDF